MGKGIAYLQNDRPAEAEAIFTHLIGVLSGTLAADDTTGRAVLSRGVRQSRHPTRSARAIRSRTRRLWSGAAIEPGAVEDRDYCTAFSTATPTRRQCDNARITCDTS